MKRLSAILAILILSTLAPLVGTAGAQATSAARERAPQANRDRISVKTGDAVVIRVKANDRVFKKQSAKITVREAGSRAASRLAAVRRDSVIWFRATRDLEPGRYVLRYRVTDVQGRTDSARVVLRVKGGKGGGKGGGGTTTDPDVVSPPIVTEEPTPDVSLPLMDVIAAQDLSNRVGIRDFPHYDTTTYGHRDAIESSLGDLGVEWVTVKYVPARDEIADLERLHALGIKTILTVGETKGGYLPESDAFWGGLANNLVRWGDNVPMVVGWNEPNHIRGSTEPLPQDWALRTLRDNLVPLRRAVDSANARTGLGVDVGLPALWSGSLDQFRTDARALAAARYTDATGRTWSVADTIQSLTFHLYPRGVDPTWELDNTIEIMRATFPSADRTPWCTEAGYFTASNYSGGAKSVTEAQQAVYVAKMGLEYLLRGGYVSYFELAGSPDPTDSDREASLGLIKTPSIDPSTWQRKPAFSSLATILARKGGTATQVRAEVVGPADVQHVATVDETGSVVMYLWRRVNVDADGNAPPVSVTVRTSAGDQVIDVGGGIVTVALPR